MMSGAEHAGATVLHSCFDKKFEAANFKWEGTCGEDVTKICYDEDGWKMDGTQCSKGCTGVATYAQIDLPSKVLRRSQATCVLNIRSQTL